MQFSARANPDSCYKGSIHTHWYHIQYPRFIDGNDNFFLIWDIHMDTRNGIWLVDKGRSNQFSMSCTWISTNSKHLTHDKRTKGWDLFCFRVLLKNTGLRH